MLRARSKLTLTERARASSLAFCIVCPSGFVCAHMLKKMASRLSTCLLCLHAFDGGNSNSSSRRVKSHRTNTGYYISRLCAAAADCLLSATLATKYIWKKSTRRRHFARRDFELVFRATKLWYTSYFL